VTHALAEPCQAVLVAFAEMVEQRPELIRCTDLRIGYGATPLLPPIEMTIRAGEFWAVIGRNGSGKTTWMRTVLGLVDPVGGRVERSDQNLKLSYLPQKSRIDELYPLIARDVVGMALDRGWSFLRRLHQDRAQRIERALAEMDAVDIADRPFRLLSDGQKQRVLFARLAASDAELALLDEPTSAMDLVAEHEAFELLNGLRKRHGTAIVIVSHYLGLAREFADKILLVDRDMQVVVIGTPAEVFAHAAFRERYGRVSNGDHG
jgi:zinc transport system ATP-binding protein